MQASALVYCKKSPKRVLLVSEDEHLKEEIEGILSQIKLPEIINRQGGTRIDNSVLVELNPHMVIIDYDSFPDVSLIKRVKQFDPELPVVVVHTAEKISTVFSPEIKKGLRFMARDTVRFSGQIFYKSIHSYAIKNFQEQRENTQQKIEGNIQGLSEIKSFWMADSHQISSSYREVLAELESTLSYLQMLKEEFDTIKPSSPEA